MNARLRTARRTYVDASVFGGVFDDEFCEASARFFEQAVGGRFLILTSALIAEEIADAPPEVQKLYDSHIATAEILVIDHVVLDLQAAYLGAAIVTSKWADDALHVALATVGGADLIVSWNFRHIVHVDKAPRYNAVNRLHGFSEVAIHAPNEVIEYEDGEEI
ncbi:MAG: hypothetical protein L6R00_21200 [Phycisphaerae bacterium]|nr:hypothetical protein [Phycisphaerae bacterium]